MTNSCPACGNELFSSRDMNMISTIQGGLGSQPFAFNFTEETLYDISLYIFNELEHGIGQVMVAEALERASQQPAATEDEESEDPMDDIRKEIESEFQEEIEEITDGQEEDIFSKAERLKRLAQQRKTGVSTPQERPRISATRKTGTPVRRSQ
jgi:hypothetical protein